MGTWVAALLAGALGAAVGAFVPRFAQRFAEYKQKKRGQELKADSRYTGWAAVAASLLCNGIGWGLCWYFGSALPAVLAALAWTVGEFLLILDLRLRILPNELLLNLLAVGVILQLLVKGPGTLPAALLTAFAVTLVFMMLGNFMGLYKIGAGDVKLAAVMTLTLGYPGIFPAFLAMAASMFLFCGVGLLLQKITLKSFIPFGPFLIPGLWIGLLLLI